MLNLTQGNPPAGVEWAFDPISRILYHNGTPVSPLSTQEQVTTAITDIVFPDVDPEVEGAGYWVEDVLTKSAGPS